MAKLNVTIPANEVTVGDVIYRKVDRKPQAGDIVKALVFNADITAGQFYAVNVDNTDGLYVIDDAEDHNWSLKHCPRDYEVYVPVNAEVTAEITYDNAKYRKVERDAQEGDVIVFTDEDEMERYLTLGKPYLVNEIDYAGDPQITDDDGDDFDACGYMFDVYEKVAQVYREVKRKAAVGERIKIEEAYAAMDRYVTGDEFTVKSVRNDGAVYVEEPDRVIAQFEYVVLEPVTAAVSAKPKRLTVGDYANVVDSGASFPLGTIVKIIVDDGTDIPYRAEDINGETHWAKECRFAPATEAEFLAQRKPTEPVRLKVGDYAKVTNPDYCREDKRGHIVEIFVDEEDHQPYKARSLTNGGENWYHVRELTPATPEEVSAAQRKLAIGTFAVGGYAVVVDVRKSDCVASSIRNGDYVKVAVTEVDGPYALELVSHGEKAAYSFCNADALRQITEEEYNVATQPKPAPLSVGDYVRITRERYSGDTLKIGEVRKISKVDGSFIPYKADKLDGSDHDWFNEGTLVKLTAEEAQEEQRWAKIGRKVGEFKRGDIVEVTDASCLHSSTGIKNGDIVILGDNDEFDDMFRLLAPGVTNGNYAVTKRFKLVTPVEQRFDTAA